MCAAIGGGRLHSAQKIAGVARWIWQRAPPSARNIHYSATLLASGLFDTAFYASQAGIRPEPDRCVAHYLKHGAAAGFSANRLFDGAAYLGLHPDVAAAQMDPFVHFVAFGIGEGRRNQVPDSGLAHVASMPSEALRERRVSEQALAAGWRRDLPSAWRNSTVAVYASSLGNFFFRHIADRIADGLRASGVRAYRLDQNSARPLDVRADVFVAPHEFFHLGSGPRWRDAPEVARSIMLNTEQPGTSWYFLALRYAAHSTTLVDLSPQSALLLREFGRSQSGYFPVGFLPERLATAHNRPHDVAAVRGLEALAASRKPWSRRYAGEWRERPLDVIFLGTLTPRRSRALGWLASALSRYKCFIHAPTGRGAPLTGEKRSIGVEESLLLAGNAKVMLNLHRDEFSYFEWHRVMMMGIEQGALVLSEPCFPLPGVEPGRHFLTAHVEEMPSVLARLLESTEGEIHAQQVDEFKAHELRERFDLRAELSALAFLHSKGFPQRD
jgi:hypothetical protein